MANSKTIVTENENNIEPVAAPAATESIAKTEAKAQATLVRKEQERKNLATFYLSEKKIPVTISPFYAPYLGRVVPVLVNGIRVDIPADGRTYQINETHAGEIIAKIRRIDEFIARQKKASNVSENFESSIGELQI